jgi:ferritin-like protein
MDKDKMLRFVIEAITSIECVEDYNYALGAIDVQQYAEVWSKEDADTFRKMAREKFDKLEDR